MTIHQADLPLTLGHHSQLLIIDTQERLANAMPPDDLASALGNIKRLGGRRQGPGYPHYRHPA